MGPDGTPDVATRDAILRVFRDASAVWTLDELARRFSMSISEAIRVMSDLEAIDVVRRIGDEYVPGYGAATAS
jgi:DNA-binding IclR family transcriptional regulator